LQEGRGQENVQAPVSREYGQLEDDKAREVQAFFIHCFSVRKEYRWYGSTRVGLMCPIHDEELKPSLVKNWRTY
jgi:hypothetical protein